MMVAFTASKRSSLNIYGQLVGAEFAFRITVVTACIEKQLLDLCVTVLVLSVSENNTPVTEVRYTLNVPELNVSAKKLHFRQQNILTLLLLI